MDFFSILWIFLIISSLQPVIRQRMLEAARRRILRELEVKRHSRVIALIHRQETVSVFGVPVSSNITTRSWSSTPSSSGCPCPRTCRARSTT